MLFKKFRFSSHTYVGTASILYLSRLDTNLQTVMYAYDLSRRGLFVLFVLSTYMYVCHLTKEWFRMALSPWCGSQSDLEYPSTTIVSQAAREHVQADSDTVLPMLSVMYSQPQLLQNVQECLEVCKYVCLCMCVYCETVDMAHLQSNFTHSSLFGLTTLYQPDHQQPHF